MIQHNVLAIRPQRVSTRPRVVGSIACIGVNASAYGRDFHGQRLPEATTGRWISWSDPTSVNVSLASVPSKLLKVAPKQVIHRPRDGRVQVVDAAPPAFRLGWVLVANCRSLPGGGNERNEVEIGKKNLIQKSRARPDLVREIADRVSAEGVRRVVAAARERLEVLAPPEHPAVDGVLRVGPGLEGVTAGDHVACAGTSADHAETIAVPRNLVAKMPDEEQPIVILRAFAAGTPVIASSAGGIPETVDEAGIFVPVREREVLASAIERVLADAALRGMLASRGRVRYENEYSVAAFAERLVCFGGSRKARPVDRERYELGVRCIRTCCTSEAPGG